MIVTCKGCWVASAMCTGSIPDTFSYAVVGSIPTTIAGTRYAEGALRKPGARGGDGPCVQSLYRLEVL